MKTTKILLLIAIVIGVGQVNMAQQTKNPQNKWKIYGAVTVIPALSMSGTIGDAMSIKDIPLTIRNVPKHPDDAYIPQSNMGPIEVSSLEEQKYWWDPGIVELCLGIGNDKMQFEVGGVGRLNWTKQETVERNYANGGGAALTYIKLNDYNWVYGYSGLFRLRLNKLDDPKVFGFVRYAQHWQNVSLTTGWDRYSNLEEYQKYSIATLTGCQVALGPELESENFYTRVSLGYQWNSIA
ncbi:MAG: hypothetical protein WCJ39_10255, partial [bacterium]